MNLDISGLLENCNTLIINPLWISRDFDVVSLPCVRDWLSTTFTLLLHAKATLDESSSGCPDGGMVDTRDLKSLDQ